MNEITANTGVDNRGVAYWVLHVPEKVTLSCPQCGSPNEREVSRCEDADVIAGHAYIAEIDWNFCEDCSKKLCPRCPRFPHPDDSELLQCSDCHEQSQRAG